MRPGWLREVEEYIVNDNDDDGREENPAYLQKQSSLMVV
jgi:hypothetical protein